MRAIERRIRTHPHRKQARIIDRVNRPILADDRWRVRFPDTGCQREYLRERVGRQVPAVKFAVLAVGEYALREWIDRGGIDAPFANGVRMLRGKFRIGRLASDRQNFLHHRRIGAGIDLGCVWIQK